MSGFSSRNQTTILMIPACQFWIVSKISKCCYVQQNMVCSMRLHLWLLIHEQETGICVRFADYHQTWCLKLNMVNFIGAWNFLREIQQGIFAITNLYVLDCLVPESSFLDSFYAFRPISFGHILCVFDPLVTIPNWAQIRDTGYYRLVIEL